MLEYLVINNSGLIKGMQTFGPLSRLHARYTMLVKGLCESLQYMKRG